MLRNLPFVGSYPILQGFGDNPEAYQAIRCGGQPLRGHNGIDYATPPGTPIQAVYEGAVLEAREDPGGFGRFVLLGHRWGQSLYAHLAEIQVQKGQQVQAGQPLGRSGASGNASAPHLHFGMRILPFSIQDGWCGFSDPLPYLQRLTQPRGAIIGPHIIGGIPPHLETLRRWQPRLVLVLDPNPDEVRALRRACPDTVIVGRVFVPDAEVDQRIRNDPEAAARWAHERILARMTPDVDYWQLANEVLQTADGLPLLNRFELARMALAEEAGYRCAILGFSVGNPDLPENDRMAHWRLVYPALERAEASGHVVAVHQYGMPDLWGPNHLYDWYIHRLEHQVLRRLPFKKLQFAVTEFGIDGMIQGQTGGWQTFTDADGYVEQLLRAGRYLERFSGRVLGYAVFTLGHFHPWGTYDIAGEAATLLAERSQRGTWSQISIDSVDIVPGETDTTTDPGGTATAPPSPGPGPGEGGGTEPEPDGEEPAEEPGEEPGGGTEEEPGGGQEPSPPPVERRLSESFDAYHMRIWSLEERPDQQEPLGPGDIVYLVKDVFTTVNGSWEVSGQPGSVPQWARDAYLRPEFLEAGADHHLFAAVIGLDGQLVKNHEILFWSDGFERLGDPSYNGYIRERTKESSGWANLFMSSSSSFSPERGESGPWCWAPAGAAEVICGGGLPLNHHVSTFVVWQAVRWEDLEAGLGEGGAEEGEQPGGEEPGGEQPGGEQPGGGEPGGEEPGGEEPGGQEPDGGTPAPGGFPITRRLSPWVEHYNLRIQSLDARPDHPQGDIVYLVKDIFTTRDGSWEPSDQPGSVPQWARDDYLKPFGAPDYFDDAGGDHHLFAAVIGLDGQLMRGKEIVYWSDGFDKLGDPTYNGYIYRQTKEQSGWANIITGPGSSYVPERGESGPWCWAPTGAAEVVCGGGMPSKHHISMFVVWQAVRREDLGGQPAGGEDRDHSIFLPFVSASPAPLRAGDVGTTPEAAAAAMLNVVRSAAWSRLGIEFDPNSALATYARQNGLGMPVTQEFRVGDFRVQGFQGGIVFAPAVEGEGMVQGVRHIPW
ncbi:M23 family metallopeptidase [Litorilinea aerophila]|uniref:M23 family metallopeptidase n=1 Tax=Litorilinea aerophila TaxID=1204385 RepID=A0A540VLG9_9CHLR|nr:M23 family metallopeptidase [Litorilinea aerophila]MCC9074815.1 M23 family metallopeptidase [Litorilinea aerophila]